MVVKIDIKEIEILRALGASGIDIGKIYLSQSSFCYTLSINIEAVNKEINIISKSVYEAKKVIKLYRKTDLRII